MKSSINTIKAAMTPDSEVLQKLFEALPVDVRTELMKQCDNPVELGLEIASFMRNVIGMEGKVAYDLIFGKGAFEKLVEMLIVELS